MQGDKGGSSTKLSAQLVNVNSPNSPDNTDPIAIYEAQDTYDNLHPVFSTFKKDIETLQEPGYNLDLGPDQGFVPIHVFLYGDYEFLTKNFGRKVLNSKGYHTLSTRQVMGLHLQKIN